MTRSIRELRNTPEDVLIRDHDVLAESTVAGVDYYLNELARRENLRQQATMIKLTYAIAVMTLIVTIATIVNLIVFIAAG
jgi:hypothetical protein